MSLKQLLKKLTLATLLAGATYSLSNSALAQSLYYYPSASFFSPFAHSFQSDDAVDLATILEDEKFATFNSSLQEAGLLETVEQEDLLTVLAPTEEAFAALSPELKQKLSDPETMKQVMQYHLILGSIGEEEIQRREVATLLDRNSVKITGVPTEKNKMTVKLNEATASEPLGAVNGVIIPIDEVLIPQGL
ncbi:MAG: fasciclin domain-containing protein [Pleurocapsa sp. MO_226.B13]|nr:fasciclin domain-containing protein [Pleurocapsa sp. MO_226.B13]